VYTTSLPGDWPVVADLVLSIPFWPAAHNWEHEIHCDHGISAYRRSADEYLVFVEEDARGKVLTYRWKL
jgi:hypothetical protein